MICIRTITASVFLSKEDDAEKIRDKIGKASSFLSSARTILSEKTSFEVQTVRITFNPVDEWVNLDARKEDSLTRIKNVDKILETEGVDFANIGPIREKRHIDLAKDIICNTKIINTSISLDKCVGCELDFDACLAAAAVVKGIAHDTESGLGNFRFCVSSCVEPGVPFYPSSYFEGETPQFSIGLETSLLLEEACSRAIKKCTENGERRRDLLLKYCEEYLISLYKDCLGSIQRECCILEQNYKFTYQGIDGSMNPSLRGEGIGSAFRNILSFLTGKSGDNFGSTGSLAVSYLITRAIRKAGTDGDVKMTGYSGLMLPQLEDKGLAEAGSKGLFSVSDLLMCSSVCGVGVDTVPVAGDVALEKLALLIMDMHCLAIKWMKPLSCRVMPVPGKKAGEMSCFDSPYLTNSMIMKI